MELEQLLQKGASFGMILPSVLSASTCNTLNTFQKLELDLCPTGSSRQLRVNTVVDDIEFCESAKSVIKFESIESGSSDVSLDMDDLDNETKVNMHLETDVFPFSIKREQIESLVEIKQCLLNEVDVNYHKDHNQLEKSSQKIDQKSLKTKPFDISKCVSIDFRFRSQKSATSLNDALKNPNEYNALRQQMRSMKFPENNKRTYIINPGCFETLEFHGAGNSLKRLNDSHDDDPL